MAKAWELLEKGWCQREYAKTVDDYRVSPTHSSAVSWCARGAIWAVYKDVRSGPFARSVQSLLIEALGNKINAGIVKWNDASGQTQSAVVETVKEVEERLRNELHLSE